MKDKSSGILSFLIFIICIGDYGIGVVHSFKKHGVADGLIGVVAFPWAMYRGIEFWWHDDHADVNWDKRLPNDMQTCIYFLLQTSNEDVNILELNEDLERFAAQVNKYPADKKQFLMDGTRKYIEYGNSVQNDFVASLNEYLVGGNFEWITSQQTAQLENDFKTFKLEEDIELIKKGFDEVKKEIIKSLTVDSAEIDDDSIKDFEARMNLLMEIQQKAFRRIFTNIFDEEL